MFKHFLVPTDGSPASRKAAKAGIALARRTPRGKGLCLLRARRAACDLHRTLCIQTAGLRQFRQARLVAQKRVDEIGKMAKPTGVPFISVMAKAFTPREELVTAGDKAQVRHDLHGLARPPRPFPAGYGQRHPESAVATPRCRWWCATDPRRTLQPFPVVTTYKQR